MPQNPILTVLTRAGRAESVHRGAIAVATPTRQVVAIGDVASPVYPRSALKPFQAIPLLEDGLDRALQLSESEIALTTASHSGDESHVETAAALLAKGGVPSSALLCGSHAPMDEAAARRLVREGREPTSLHHNCSGKHAGMLIQAKHLGAPLESYVDPNHPVQRRIRQRIADFSGVRPDELTCGVDGCSAPAFALPLAALARAMARFADPSGLAPATADAARRLFDAAAAQPHFVSGRKRFDLAVAKAGARRIFCKGGAEGVLAMAIRAPNAKQESVGVAIKVDDGNARGYYLPALALLRWLGFDPPAAKDELTSASDAIQRNYRGIEVGRVEVDGALLTLPPSPWTAR
jgi:L-asparaginase II